MEKINKSEEEWRKELSDEQYHILREKGTERPWTGALLENKEKGIYECAACGNALYSSETKYESGSGWPSFYDPISADAVDFETDKSFGMTRTEVKCGKCGGHLGHIFPDGPEPSGQRYCMNSGALSFKKKD
ncbi:peptide-methionine (R)-S-oxide reductase [Ekhidna lutea]|uniref:Peptide methionine sulfoxide reductase MsrB n=1 Tax=Ekhidna lutea TaxID=447679 RepID=A0A239LKG1_EKHLU|nr:peptide-methionine (R)-S-oxide reductase MsrB [Ekhidna lutea]SNT30875.1 peptide-methionine (R)-S-oxide reductase [Ekhidna lutea]